jgi:hypothetical protein
MNKIHFANPDSPEAAEALRALVERVHLPIVGLLIKVNERDEVVNIELSDEYTVKALALAAALEEENTERE